jgi:HD-GYP domain-containing protein (c-di-GMP phosphodiesterase class II)
MHPLFGAGILSQHPHLDTAAEIVATHHERWDGLGYPYGLAGGDIPLGARVIAVVDAYDAMTAGRPYQGAVVAEAAMARLDACAGTQFDAAVVLAMHSVVPLHVVAA